MLEKVVKSRVKSLTAADAAIYRKAIVGRLEHEVGGWRDLGNAALARQLDAMGVRTATGLRHDADTVRDFRRTLARKASVAAAEALTLELSDADEIDQMRRALVRIITDLDSEGWPERLAGLDFEIVQIGGRLCEDRFMGNDMLERGWATALRKLAKAKVAARATPTFTLKPHPPGAS